MAASLPLRTAMAPPSPILDAQEQDLSSTSTSSAATPPPNKKTFLYILKVSGKWVLTPKGFLITLYMLNVIAWGGMIFLLLVNAAPAMCKPTCDDLFSPRRKWIEIDAQILNALFSLTAFGLIPWRFRDLYWLLVWRLGIRGATKKSLGLSHLAIAHKGWFRTQDVGEVISPGLGGNDRLRAPLTASWKMDFVVWSFVWNTLFQAILSGFMWGYNRFERPNWAVALWLCLGMASSAAGGLMMFFEGRKVTKIEGKETKGQA